MFAEDCRRDVEGREEELDAMLGGGGGQDQRSRPRFVLNGNVDFNNREGAVGEFDIFEICVMRKATCSRC